jgi:hypothetical protein
MEGRGKEGGGGGRRGGGGKGEGLAKDITATAARIYFALLD